MTQQGSDRFLHCVLVQFNPANCSPQDIAQAARYCESLMFAERGFTFVLSRLSAYTETRVVFYLLQSIDKWVGERWNAVSAEDKKHIIQGLLQWQRQRISLDSTSEVVRRKFAHTLGLLFVEEWPSGWPSFFSDLLAMMQDNPWHVDLFLCVLDAIDELVVSSAFTRTVAELARNSELKNQMREHAVPGIVNACKRIMVQLHERAPHLVEKCLCVYKKYVDWIDIRFTANAEVMGLFQRFLREPVLQKETIKCLTALVNKGMPPLQKLDLIAGLHLIELCASVSAKQGSRTSIHCARLANQLGNCVLEGVSELVKTGNEALLGQGRSMLRACLQLLNRYLEFPDDAAKEVISFATSYVGSLRDAKLNDAERNNLYMLLSLACQRLKYPEDFDFEHGDEEEQEFQRFRGELLALFKSVGRSEPALCISVVEKIATDVLPRHSRLPWTQSEAILHLILSLGEVLAMQGRKAVERAITPFLQLILSSKVAENGHWAVTREVLEVIIRYLNYMHFRNGEMVSHFLQLLVDGRGLRNGHVSVRARAAYGVLRLVKRFAKQLAGRSEDVLSALGEFLDTSGSDNAISYDCQCYLLEAAGWLIASVPDAEREEQQLAQLLGPYQAKLVAILKGQVQGLSAMQLSALVCRLVESAGFVSKGFSGCVNRNQRSTVLFTQIMQSVFGVLKMHPNDEEVHSKCMLYLHRMVECLQHEFLNSLDVIVAFQLRDGGPKEVQDFMRLMTQLLNRFRQNIEPKLNQIITPLVHKVFQLVKQGNEEVRKAAPLAGGLAVMERSELGREVNELRAKFYWFLFNLVRSEAANVLCSPQNAQTLQLVVNALMQGIVWWGQTESQKNCWGALGRMVQLWAPQSADLRKWALETYLPNLACFVFNTAFRLEDAQNIIVMRQVMSLQLEAATMFGTDFAAILGRELQQRFNAETVQQYLALLGKGEVEPLWRFLDKNVRQYKRRQALQ